MYDSPSPDAADPLFARFQEVKRREKQFAAFSMARRKKRRADRAASTDPAKGLVNDATLLLHTVDAQQLLVGTLPRGSGAMMTNGVSGVLRACSSIALLYPTNTKFSTHRWLPSNVGSHRCIRENQNDSKANTALRCERISLPCCNPH